MWQSGGQGVPSGPGGGYGMGGEQGSGMMSMQQALLSQQRYGGYGAMYPGYPMSPYGGQGMGGQQGCGYGWGYGGGSYLGYRANGQGKGKGFGKGKGKGRGKGFSSGERGFEKGAGNAGAYDSWKAEGFDGFEVQDPRRAIEIAQKRAKQRDRSAISLAQRSAQQRFEQSLLDRIQGRWVDMSDPTCTYEVEGSLCSVSSTANPRIFRNRITLYGGELCWDARRFWHYLKLDSLPPAGEEVERVDWTPGEGSPPTQPITWLRAPPIDDQPEVSVSDEDDVGGNEEAAEAKAEGEGEAKEGAAEEAPAPPAAAAEDAPAEAPAPESPPQPEEAAPA